MHRGSSSPSLGSLKYQGSNMSGFGGTPAFSFGQASSAAPTSAFGGFGQPAATGFGAPAAAAFGAPAATGFGAPAASAFGAPAASAFGAPAATGFGAPAAGAFGASSAFGAPAAGAFGAPAATGFGAPAAAAFGAPAAGGFGAPAAGGFGASSGFGSFGGFGAPAAATFGAPAATGFGAPAAGGFGAPGAGGFGAPAAGGFGTSGGFGGFGAPPSSAFGAAPAATAQSAVSQLPGCDRVLDIQLSYAAVLDNLTGMPSPRMAADRPQAANEAMCKFDSIMYTAKPLGGNGRHQVNAGSRWEQAERDNPEPDALEAVRELGIAALTTRFKTQSTECVKYRVHTADLRGIVEAVDTSTRQTGLRLEALQMKQTLLYNKMLSVVRSVEVLRCQGVPIDSAERRYRERLQRLLVGLRMPHTKLQELSVIGSQQDRPNDVYSDSISQEDIDAICSVLKKQRDGLQHLTDVLTKDARDISIVKHRLKPHVQQEL